MPVNVVQWRVEFGVFDALCHVTYITKFSRSSHSPSKIVTVTVLIFTLLLLFMSGDIELNPGPKKTNSSCKFSVCHWNLNSLAAHNFEKVGLLEAFNTINKFDIICVSESYLDLTFSSDNEDINIKGFKLVRADHPNNIKRGGVCVYVRESLPVRVVPNHHLSECLILEVNLKNKKEYLVSLYRSPNQNPDEFELFLTNLENLLADITNRNPHFMLLLGDFNAKSKAWFIDNQSSREGTQLESLTSVYGMKQLIAEPTHVLENSSSCIDLIFTDQSNLIMDAGVHPSLHSKCHHQVIYAKLNLKMQYPPPYTREIWDYGKSRFDLINEAIENFDWNKDQVNLFNTTILNIFQNFIPNKVILCDDKEPDWVNEEVRLLIKQKNLMFRIQRKNSDFEIGILNKLSEDLTNAITNSKLACYRRIASKLNDPNSAPKTYWSILKLFVNGKKIPLIPPILVKDQLVTNFLEKANLFSEFFTQQCNTIENDSTLPNNLVFETTERISSFDISKDEITKIIRSLDPNKAHGYDGISIRMLKLCASSISKPLFLLFKHSLENDCFPNEWKKANIVPIHKKGDKQLIQNNRPVSLLPICGKIFEKIMFNSLFKYLENNNLLNPHQSGFRPGDSCVHQLLSITYDIYKSFDANPSLEVRSIFLDMSKAFDRVWHEGLYFKLKRLGLSGKYYGLIKSFLRNRHQRVVLNGQSSKWSSINAGVPQGSILGPLLFLVYINDLPNGLLSNPKLFADDTSIFSVVKDHLNSSNKLNEDLSKISQWPYRWKISFNSDVSKQAQEVIFSRQKNIGNHPAVFFNNLPINRSQKHLGLLLDEKLNFSEHINEKLKKVTKSINLLRKLNLTLPRFSLLIIYK